MSTNNDTSRSIFLFAGEPSGDILGSELLKKLLKDNEHLIIEGVGGPKMRTNGMESIVPMEKFLVMGFSAIIKAFPRLRKLFYYLVDTIIAKHYDAVVLIDYPGFNLRLAKALKKKGYEGKIVHYVAPSVWAWKKGRIQHMEKTLDLLITTFPFEAKHFADTSLTVRYAGHPLLEKIAKHRYYENWKDHCSIPDGDDIVAIFPGSRNSEITNNLDIILGAAEIFHKKHPSAVFAVSAANDAIATRIKEHISRYSLFSGRKLFIVPHTYTYELMKESRYAMATSGTVTLELAAHETPTVVIYNVTFFNWFLAKHIFKIKLPHYCIVNIICDKEVFPEVIGKDLSATDIAEKLLVFADDEGHKKRCIKGCNDMKDLMRYDDASAQAANEIEAVLYP
ncbi:MAG: lipid-A-disaccharide synthase [Waddliaceae bacterium]|jgi:lipid-A-disaccharide synthase|nr:lipid-A-disaccharide synthase [Waddliaceae bacterium]MBT3578412.1 lipid-A-disaccharide synthase [Waddliaceae bacterium]MBT4445264.1 lipid-A-disaccharide synthase [Waddliaceae bacterium]MBT6929138.1 lipid-A-disaccharide synthase [Waddliaceae bacterium]MBT7264637.1 lipid-A-disaccharide synthase [Waddliaceae bacterium]